MDSSSEKQNFKLKNKTKSVWLQIHVNLLDI